MQKVELSGADYILLCYDVVCEEEQYKEYMANCSNIVANFIMSFRKSDFKFPLWREIVSPKKEKVKGDIDIDTDKFLEDFNRRAGLTMTREGGTGSEHV